MEKREILDALMLLGGYRTKSGFAKRLGIRDSTLGNWYSRNTFDIIGVAKAFPEVSIDWLITGIGPMLRTHEEELEEENKMLKAEVARLKEQIDAMTKMMNK